MYPIILKKQVNEICNRLVVITGSARSGTSILGKLIYSMKKVEYSFEPPTLIGMFSQINDCDEKFWKFLFKTYVYEEFIMNNLAGRNINLNKYDESSIYHAKPQNEINKRLTKSYIKSELELIAYNSKPVVKIPSIVPFLDKFLQFFPNITIIYIKRNPIDCINSMVNKDWFSASSLKNNNRIWPVYDYNGENIPFWVLPTDFDKWVQLDTLDRYAYYFLLMSKDIKVNNLIKINYDNLILQPEKITNEIAEKLNLKYGEKTDSIIKSISKTTKNRDLEIINKMSPYYKNELLSYF